MTIIAFESVGLRYGTGAEVLRDLDFKLAEGGYYFLTGPSGAGKTSLLKLLYLAQRPTRGRIRLFGDQQKLLDSQPVFGALDAVFATVRDRTRYE